MNSKTQTKTTAKLPLRRLFITVTILLTICLAVSTAAGSEPWNGTIADSFAGGDGSEEYPYEIETAEQLAYLAQEVNAGRLETTGKYFQLTDDIDLNNLLWTPIGFWNDGSFANLPAPKGFSGTFDGNFHKITGLKITGEYETAGLFGYVDSGMIQNLEIKDTTITIVQGQFTLYGYTGSIAGYCSGTIENCNVYGVISDNESAGGGIAGYFSGTIEDCNVYGTISGSHGRYFGGIAGYCSGSGTIENCNVSGIISGSGGIAGACSGSGITIENCNVYGTISSTAMYTGGISGNGGTIRNCQMFSNITVISSYVYAGGISSMGGTIENCYVAGNLTVESRGMTMVGGISGAGGNIQNCCITGDITVTKSINLDVYVGGISGRNYGVIQNCYALGNVAADGVFCVFCVGGITGWNSGVIQNCYATGSVTGISRNSQVTSSSYFPCVGGIAGYNVPYPMSSQSVKIENCYALNKEVTVKVTQNPDLQSAARVAGMSNKGDSTGILTKNYGWKHMTVTVGESSVSISSDSNGLAGADVCAADILHAENWDFANIWQTPTEGDYLLPVLRTQSSRPTKTPEHLLVTVKFNTGGGTSIIDQKVLDGRPVSSPAVNPAKTGYTVDGWYKDTPDTEWNFATAVCLPSPLTLYAKWKANTTTITFRNGTNTQTAVATYDSSELDGSVAAPTKEGHIFNGWYTAETDGIAVIDTTGAFVSNAGDGTYTDTAGNWKYDVRTLDLYANWTVKKFPVTWVDGLGNTVATEQIEYGSPLPNAPSAPSRTGYTLSDWDNIPETMPAEEVTITAQWTPNTYTVVYDANGGTGTIAPSAHTYDSPTNAIAENSFSRTGYTFSKWTANPDGTGSSYDSGAVNVGNLADGADVLSVTLYADWIINQYTIKFNTDGGTAIADITQNFDTEIQAPADPTKTGYTFVNWDREIPAKMPAENTVIKALWSVNNYTLTFDSNGGTNVAPINQDYATSITPPKNPTRDGYTFVKWNPQIPATMPASDMTFKAEWKKNEVPSSSGGGGGKTPTTVVIPVTPPEEPDTPDIGDEYYTVTFNENGGTGVMNPQNVEIGGTVTLSENAFTRDGYTFKGWTLIQGSAVDFADGAEFTPESDVTLYAVWEENAAVPTGFPLWLLLLICGLLIAAIIGGVYLRKRK